MKVGSRAREAATRERDTDVRDADFQGFMASRWSRLLRIAFLLTGDQHAAEDLAQTSLEHAYVAWRRVSQADNPDAYMRRILINAHARLHRRSGVELLSSADRRHTAGPEPQEPDPAPRADARLALLRALSQLPPRQRQAVVLRYWEDLSESQAADAMGCSTGTVKSQVHKGLAKLREMGALNGLTGNRSEER
jgi:RNA polymerase sigma-70 factor (sigma-E family)